MSMPEIKKNKTPVSSAQAMADLLESIALEETALSHILNAEGEKLQRVIEYTHTCCSQIDKLLETNNSVAETILNVRELELVLKDKLELIFNNMCGCISIDCPDCPECPDCPDCPECPQVPICGECPDCSGFMPVPDCTTCKDKWDNICKDENITTQMQMADVIAKVNNDCGCGKAAVDSEDEGYNPRLDFIEKKSLEKQQKAEVNQNTNELEDVQPNFNAQDLAFDSYNETEDFAQNIDDEKLPQLSQQDFKSSVEVFEPASKFDFKPEKAFDKECVNCNNVISQQDFFEKDNDFSIPNSFFEENSGFKF